MAISFTLQKQLGQFQLDVSYSFSGGVLVIQGESGSGKSTILNCISGLLEPDNGRVQTGERVLFDRKCKIDLPFKQRKIGYVFQNFALFPNMTL